jgi:hypothetical protein
MKTFVLFLFVSVSVFSQTKKEMRTEIDLLKSQQAHLNLGHQIEMDQLIKKVDSLKTVIAGQNDQLQANQITINRLREELTDSNDSLARVTNLLMAKQPKKQEEKTLTTSSKNSTTNPFVSSTDNPFGSGGSGGSGSGSWKSQGTNGSGSDHGTGTGRLRTRLNDVSINHIDNEQDATIYLKLTIDANGNIISCISTSQTTTTDQRLINQVKQAVSQQVKFSKSPGAEPEYMYYTVKIVGN